MTMFGLKESEIAEPIRRVSSSDLDRARIEELFARCAWSGIAEPGDGVAGRLLSAIGAPAALSALIAQRPAADLAAQLEGDVPVREVQHAVDRWTPRLASSLALGNVRHAVRLGMRIAAPGDTEWPSGLDDLGPHAPHVLWLRGRHDIVPTLAPSVAIVGARAATGYGEHLATEWSAGLCDRGIGIVSGAAYGIDGVAHRAALASGGSTIAVLAGGADRFYPAGHDSLLTRIVADGCVVSELPCGSQPTKWRFLQRNRIIAAIADATVVVEAGWRSGSLNTAGHAATIGRPVGAAPGPATSSASAGCHRLIRDFDATLVTRVDEILELLPGLAFAAERETERSDPRHTRLLDALSPRSSRDLTELAARSGLSPSDVRAALGELELGGAVRDTGLGWVRTSGG